MINGERIRQARELKALTQKELADHVGVNQSAIAQIESGRIQPKIEVLQAISMKTGFPCSFFEQGSGPDFPLGTLLFRAHATVTASKKVQAWRYAEILHEAADKMAQHMELRALRLSHLQTDPVSAARTTRSDLGLSPDRPIPNVINTLEKAGVLVLVVPTDLDERDAFSAWVGQDPSKPVIVVSGGRPGDKLRFSVSHELGHLVIHSARQGEPREIERQANQFAAEFLLPEAAMRDVLVPPVTLTTLAPLKPKWGVSIQTLIRRAHDLGIITERQYHYLFEQLGACGWKKNEPSNLAVPVEKPRAVRKMAELLYGVPIDYKKLAEDLRFTQAFSRELIAAYEDRMPQTSKPQVQESARMHRSRKVLRFPKKFA